MLLLTIALLALIIIAIFVLYVLIFVGGPVLIVCSEVFVFVYIVVRIIKAIIRRFKN